MSDTMETQAEETIAVPAESTELSLEDSTMPDDFTPAEEINLLNDLTSPGDNDQILIEDTPNNTDSLDLAALEEGTPGVDNTQASVSETVPLTVNQCLSHSKTMSDTVQFNREEVVSDSRANALWIVCQVCKSKILQPNTGVYVESEAELPPLLKKESLNSATQEIPVEKVTEFWKIKDMFHFENIGVSKTIGTTKYLLCADCEIGPVGYHLLANPQAFFLAANRVVYAVTV